MSIIKCEICGKSYNNANGSFVNHLIREHNMTAQEYYDKFLKKDKSEGICPVCGKPTPFYNLTKGYALNCSRYCQKHSPITKEKREATNLERYGAKNVYASDYGKKKIRETWEKNYGEGIINPFQAKEIIQKIQDTNEKRYGDTHPTRFGSQKHKAAMKEKHGVEHSMQLDWVKEKITKTCLDKYEVEYVFQLDYIQEKAHSKEILKRQHETKKRNGSYKKSKPEDRTFDKLNTIFESVNRQYKEDRYPFACDFYLPERDMFIEYNGFWMHNTHWYDKNNADDINRAKFLEASSKKSYHNAFTTWTVRDVEKRNIARDNSLNYVVFWNENDVDKWIADGCPDRQDWR